jgi:hypothetical protein
MSEEKRRFRRIFFDLPAVLNVGGISYTVPEVSNLSVGGCLLEIRDKLKTGTKCTITIYIDGTRKGLIINASGEIVRSDDNILAIKFSNMSPASYIYLTNIVKHSLAFIKYNPEFRSNIL